MTSPTIPAAVMAGALGLPAVFCYAPNCWGSPLSYPIGGTLDLSDRQTAMGCAFLLDEWERQADTEWKLHPDNPAMQSWAHAAAIYCADPAYLAMDDNHGIRFLRAMIARITAIYFDHEIRRALWPGLTVEPGTLGIVEHWPDDGVWAFKGPGWEADGISRNSDSMIRTYELPGITDEAEAREAILAQRDGGTA